MFNAHRAATVDDVYGASATATYKNHLPDDVAAMAILHRAAERIAPSVGAVGVPKTAEVPKQLQPVTVPQRTDGVVTVRESSDGVGVPWIPGEDLPSFKEDSGVFRF